MSSSPLPDKLGIYLRPVECGVWLSAESTYVVALGDTGKMLTAVASLITAPHHLSQNTLQVCVHTILTAALTIVSLARPSQESPASETTLTMHLSASRACI